jgi:hypothetical protein
MIEGLRGFVLRVVCIFGVGLAFALAFALALALGREHRRDIGSIGYWYTENWLQLFCCLEWRLFPSYLYIVRESHLRTTAC